MTTFGKLREGIIVVSGDRSGPEVELFDNEQWIRQPDFPLNEFCCYSTATIDNKLYIFGKQKILCLHIKDILYMIDSENIFRDNLKSKTACRNQVFQRFNLQR